MPAIVDKAAKRAQIVGHAAEVFSQTGYHASKMADIATAAGIGKGTIYEYFATKEQLFLAVYDAWMSQYEDLVRRRVDAATDALSKVDAVRDSAVEFYQSRASQAPLLLEFWAHALRTDNPAFLDRINATREFLRSIGRDLTRELVRAGWFRDVDVSAFTDLEAGMSDGIFLTWVLEGRGFPLDKAFTFRQSVIGLGLLAPESRVLLEERLGTKLRKGFGATTRSKTGR
ncbi:MAG: TetR family transcriptional regulator [Candidatus Kapabacteria bacterium]|nr:TetR family transcriptional regulator [Candidatus Kapabacteria bacterium]